MSISWLPHRFQTGEQLDVERINDDLEKASGDIARNLAARYTYSTAIYPLEGLVNTDTAAQRSVRINRYASNTRLEVVFAELVVFSATGAVWTLSNSDTSWPSISLDTAGATTEARAVSNSRLSFSSSTVFTVSADSASTITQGYLVLHFRSDRGAQGSSIAGYTPALLNSLSSTAGSLLDTEVTAIAAATARDAAADMDLRMEGFRVRALGAGSAISWRLPGGAREKAGYSLHVVAAAGNTLTLNVDGVAIASVVGTGTGNTVTSVGSLSGSTGLDPMDSADDTIIELAASVGTVSIGYVTIFWQ